MTFAMKGGGSCVSLRHFEKNCTCVIFLTNIMSVFLWLDELLDGPTAAEAPRTCGWSAPPSRCARTSSMNIATGGQDRTRKCVCSPAAKRGLAG